MKKIAILHPDSNNILNWWAVELISYSKTVGYDVVDICDPTYQQFTDMLTEHRPLILFNFAIGDKTPYYVFASKGTAIVSFLSSTVQFGKRCIEAGAPVYIGFEKELIVVSDNLDSEDIFKQALLPVAMRMLDGWTAGNCVDSARSDLLLKAKQYKDMKYISLALLSNINSLTLLGNENYKISCDSSIPTIRQELNCIVLQYFHRKISYEKARSMIDIAIDLEADRIKKENNKDAYRHIASLGMERTSAYEKLKRRMALLDAKALVQP